MNQNPDINKDYNNNLTRLAITRVMADRNIFESSEKLYAESGIYCHINSEKIDNLFRLLIIGSQDVDNPYFGGFYFFEGKFPNDYPFRPPSVLAKTQGDNIRFHPNFYRNGKCCLSILGTWSGPGWTSCQNISTLAHSLKSLYIKNPIHQEPGWENKKNESTEIYERIVNYKSLEIAVLQMMEYPPSGFETFLPIMEDFFMKNFDFYMKKINELLPIQNKADSFHLYQLHVIYDVIRLKERFVNMKEKLDAKYASKTTKSSQSKRKCPNEPASKYEVNFMKKSENDGNNWVVVQLSNGVKRWKKYN